MISRQPNRESDNHRSVPPLEVPPELRARIEAVSNKRARLVLDHILENGTITADDIQSAGYREHRRAVMDCRDLGFVMKRVKSPGLRAGMWTLDLEADERTKREGRHSFTKTFRQEMVRLAQSRCQACGTKESMRALQIDHRIPYEIDPGSGDEVPDEYQVLCGSCNRSKSWTCETECPNWTLRDPKICTTCRWADADEYEHIATVRRRQIVLTWDDEAVADYEALKAEDPDVASLILRRLRGE